MSTGQVSEQLPGAHLNQIASIFGHLSLRADFLDWVAARVAVATKIDAAPFLEELLGSGGGNRRIFWIGCLLPRVER